MSEYKTITLPQILPYLEGEEDGDKPFLFVNPTGTLETFFTYKGHLLELSKDKISLTLHPEQKEKISENIRTNLLIGMKQGGWVVFTVGQSSSFDLMDFFKNFSYFDKDFFKPNSLRNRDYLLKRSILTDKDDYDNFGNHGSFMVKKEFKAIYLITCKIEDIKNFISVNKNISFNIIICQ